MNPILSPIIYPILIIIMILIMNPMLYPVQQIGIQLATKILNKYFVRWDEGIELVALMSDGFSGIFRIEEAAGLRRKKQSKW